MLIEEVKYVIRKYGVCSKEAYKIYEIQEKNKEVDTLINCYIRSIQALIEYIINNEKNPNEKLWNKIAVESNYLSSESIGYLYGEGFNKLCKNIRNELKGNCTSK